MRHYPNSESADDKKEVQDLNVEPWMVEQLKLNPDYVHWGPYEDYMWKEKEGWDSRIIANSWKEFEPGWTLDDYNECVNFYFWLKRETKHCEACDHTGYNPETKIIGDSWYDHEGNLTQEEVQALYEHQRLGNWDKEKKQWIQPPECPSPEEVNLRYLREPLLHDSINRCICIEARATKLGVWGYCPQCNGEGTVFIEEKGHLDLILWMVHPRKGASRGVHIKNIQKDELPRVYKFLQEAQKRNNGRFSKIASL